MSRERDKLWTQISIGSRLDTFSQSLFSLFSTFLPFSMLGVLRLSALASSLPLPFLFPLASKMLAVTVLPQEKKQ